MEAWGGICIMNVKKGILKHRKHSMNLSLNPLQKGIHIMFERKNFSQE